MSFVGREEELASLNREYREDSFRMTVVYGRRRIGKTALLRKFAEEKKTLFFTAVESSSAANLTLFSKEIYRCFLPEQEGLPPFPDFISALDYITKHKSEKVLLIFDEYPYLAESEQSFSSLLQKYIDTEWRESRFYLVLCGSSMGFMVRNVLSEKSPLFGRRTSQLHVREFDYREAARFFPDYSPEEKASVYGMVGGVPQYLSLIDSKKSVWTNMTALFLEKSGYLYEETDYLLRQELRDIKKYNAIIEAIACGSSKQNEIVTSAHLDSPTVVYCLKSLMELEIIKKEAAVTEETNRKKSYYSLNDQMFRFWYRFVSQGRQMIEVGRGKECFETSIRPFWEDYMGAVFEKIARQYVFRYIPKKDKVALHSIGRWWGNDPVKKQEAEVDIVGADPIKKEIILGECKYRNQRFGIEEAEKLLDRSRLFPGYKVMEYYLCSKKDFSEDVRNLAKTNSIRLVSLAEMYEE